MGIILILAFIGFLVMIYIMVDVKRHEKKHPYGSQDKKIEKIISNKSTDKVIDCHTNGQISSEIHFKDGKQHGKYFWWYDNSQLSLKGYYKNDEKDGEWTEWYDNGHLKSKKTYKDGEEVTGESRYWDDSTFFSEQNSDIVKKMENYIKHSSYQYIDHYLSHRDETSDNLELFSIMDLDIEYKPALAYLNEYAEKIKQKEQYVQFSIRLRSNIDLYNGKLWNGNTPRLSAKRHFDMPIPENWGKYTGGLDQKFFAVTGIYNDSQTCVKHFDSTSGGWGSIDDIGIKKKDRR